jgi:hypothetical protein
MSEEPSLGDAPFPPGSAWSGEARALLERAIERHGGWPAWRAAGRISLRLEALGGLVPLAKGLGRTFPKPGRVDVWPREGRAIFGDYPAAGGQGVFSRGEVRLIDAHGGGVSADARHRTSFSGARRYRRWSPVDALYFFGYAVTHYHGLPFTLVDGRPLGMASASLGGRRLRGVRVALPPSLHTHCRTQTFFFGDDGLLLRHDYVADIIGSWARGAHLWEDFTEVGGLAVARRRRVLVRIGARTLPVIALRAELQVASASAPA